MQAVPAVFPALRGIIDQRRDRKGAFILTGSAQPSLVRGASWETFVLEDIQRREWLQRPFTQTFFWRTAAGAEVDLNRPPADGHDCALVVFRGGDVYYPDKQRRICVMSDIRRILDVRALLEKKSFFLFGPRATGKSTLIRQQLADDACIIDLLDSRNYLRLSAAPSDLEAMIAAANKAIVVIDEVQRVPELLNEVHRLIETKRLRFLLTGSSARKLRRGQSNLLAGRAWEARLFPFIFREIPGFDLDRYLLYGGLPMVWLGEDPAEELDAYAHTYLTEEILAEGLVRRLPPFSRFLRSMALSNGEMLNFAKLAADCQVPPSTVSEYVAILEDTLVGKLLPAWTGSKKRKAIRTAKFYFFDCGVTHFLSGTRTLDRNSDLYGKSFEQFIGGEIRAWLSYQRIKEPLAYWRSAHGDEVDFVIGEGVAVEVKASARVSWRDFKGLDRLAEEGVFKHYLLVSQDPTEMRDGVRQALSWQSFLDGLWSRRWL